MIGILLHVTYSYGFILVFDNNIASNNGVICCPFIDRFSDPPS